MLQSMDEAMERQQIKFSIQTVTFAIEDMLKKGETHMYYSNIVQGDRLDGPGILQRHIIYVLVFLQEKYRGKVVISRTPGGIVVHRV